LKKNEKKEEDNFEKKAKKNGKKTYGES